MFSPSVYVCVSMCVCMQVPTAHSSHKIVLDLLQRKLDPRSGCDMIDIGVRN